MNRAPETRKSANHGSLMTSGERRLSETIGAVREMFMRRWLPMLLATGVIFAAAAATIMLMPSRYTSTAHVRIDPTRNPLASSQGDALATLTSESIETEVAAFRSPELSRLVVRRLNLERDPEFTKGLGRTAASRAEARGQAIAARVEAGLTVAREGLTYVIAVSFTSRDPESAARIANAFAEGYIDLRVGSGIGTAERKALFFQQRLDALSREANDAEARLARYRAANGIVGDTAGGTITDQQIAPLSTQLAAAEAEAADARASLTVAEDQIASGGLDAVSEVRSSPVMADLRRQRAEVLRAKGEIESRYGEKHPESIKVRDQLQALDQQIEAEAQRAVGTLRAGAVASEARVGSLRSTLAHLRGEQAQETRASATAAELERDATAKRDAYDRTAQLSLQSTQAAQNSIAQAEIVDRASTPTSPSSPKRKLLLFVSAVVALAGGLAVAITLDLLQAGMRTTADIEERYGIPVLAAVPDITRRRSRQLTSAADLVITEPASAYVESIRNARASLARGPDKDAARLIALTSALPREGKTTLSLALARTCAKGGMRTLLIDCDLRRATLAGVAGRNVDSGLVQLLQGKVGRDEVIIRDQVAGLDLLPVAAPFFESEDQFADLMSELVAWARHNYATVLLDLPPILGVAYARTLAAQADRVVFAVKWGKTPPSAFETALTLLQADGASISGAIYTMVTPNAEGMGALSYASRHAAYYQQA